MDYNAIIFISLIGGLLVYLVSGLGLSIYLDYSNAAQVRDQLLYRLRLLQMQPLFLRIGIDDHELLHSRPLHEVERLIRQCESCRVKEECIRRLSRGEKHFDYCPLKRDLSPGTSVTGAAAAGAAAPEGTYSGTDGIRVQA